MAINTFNFGFDYSAFEKLQQIQQLHNKFYTPAMLESIQAMQNIFSQLEPSYMKSVAAALQSVACISPQIQETIDIAQKLSQQYAPVLEGLSAQQSWLSDIIPSLGVSLKEAFPASLQESTFAGINTFLTTFSNRMEALNLPDNEQWISVNDLADTDKEIVAEEIRQAIGDRVNWQQRLMAMLLKYREKNPIIAWFIQNIILALIINIVAGVIINAIGQVFKPASIREAPETSSCVVYQIKSPQTVMITGEVPYYYEVQFTLPDTQEQIVGYISKRSVENIQPIDSPSISVASTEE